MFLEKEQIFSKIHLLISVVIVAPAAIIYGFSPDLFLDLQINTIDEINLLKAITGLYLAFSSIWLLALFKNSLIQVAQSSNMVFMLGLGLGRVLSFILEGVPSYALIYGAIGELLLGFYGIWLLFSYNTKKPIP
jgi:hypothetical protein